MESKEKSKYDVRNLSFRVFRQKHFEKVKSFKAGDTDLMEFILQDALRSQELSISTTFLIFERGVFAEGELLGFITILNDSTRLDADLKATFKAKGIQYKSIPAIKIGRLCVDERYRGKGVGKAALSFAAKKAVFMNQCGACRFINIDAKRNEDKSLDSFHFYTKHGFKILKEKKGVDAWKQTSGTTPMYLDLYHVIKMAKAKHNF